MDPLLLVVLAAGLALGLAAGWALGVRGKGETSRLAERLAAREQRIADLVAAEERLRHERADLQERWQREAEARSAAEGRAGRLGALEGVLDQRERSLEESRGQIAALRSDLAVLQTRVTEERKAAEKQLAFVEEARTRLSDTFRALASESLSQAGRSFLETAQETFGRFHAEAKGDLARRQQAVEQIVDPLKQSLSRVDKQLQEMEQTRREAYGGLVEQVKGLSDAQRQLHAETSRLAEALRAPTVRGRWGEIQLRRVVELAGMLAHCDFVEQREVPGDSSLRPDLVVQLPGGKTVVVDAKAPLKSYLEAQEERDEGRRRTLLGENARQLKGHMSRLAAKAYWEQFPAAPEFVVLFLPGESFFSAALEGDPTLIEHGVDRNVLVATPTTLIALLRAVAYGWRHERLAESAQVVSDLGKELYDRLRVLAEHVSRMGTNLDRAVDSYNRAVASLETRVLVSARRFGELGVGTGKDIPDLVPVERAARDLEGADWELPAGKEPGGD